MPDLLRDLSDVIRNSGKPGLKRERLLKQVKKMGRRWREAGVDVEGLPQHQFCNALAEAAKVFVLKCEMGDDEKDPKHWMFKLCIARLTRGDFSDWTGWEYRNEWAIGSYNRDIPNPRWRLEPRESIAVLGEQGIGDEVMFGSCLPDLMVRIQKVVYECDPRLVDIFKRSLPGLDTKPRPMADIVHDGISVVKYLTAKRDESCFIPVGDLPRLFRKSKASFPGKPFLKPLQSHVDKWAHLKGRTGIAWRSRTGQVKPQEFGVENPVSLQFDAWPYELEGLEVPECDLKNDVEDILGICANLERVVAVPGTVVHFAGAIGTTVDVVLPTKGSGRVFDSFRYRYTTPKMAWYPAVSVHENLTAYKNRI